MKEIDGLSHEELAEQTQEYRVEQDITGMWLDECTETDPFHATTTTDLYANYKSWAEANGLRPMSNVILGRRLSDRGLIAERNHNGRFWSGIKITRAMHYGGGNAPY